MKKLSKRDSIIVTILSVFAIAVIAADLILVYTSQKQTGVGRGFSRFCDQ